MVWVKSSVTETGSLVHIQALLFTNSVALDKTFILSGSMPSSGKIMLSLLAYFVNVSDIM